MPRGRSRKKVCDWDPILSANRKGLKTLDTAYHFQVVQETLNRLHAWRRHLTTWCKITRARRWVICQWADDVLPEDVNAADIHLRNDDAKEAMRELQRRRAEREDNDS